MRSISLSLHWTVKYLNSRNSLFEWQIHLFYSFLELEGTLEGLNLDDGNDEERGVEVGKPVTFSVDAAGAGEGTLELVVSTPSTTVKAEVSSIKTRWII